MQRLYDPLQVTKLEAAWDPLFAGTLTISQRSDGTFWVVDGNHRKEAALRKDPDAVMDCEIHTGLSIQQEALMFLRLNKDRKRVRPYDIFRVALKAGLPEEVRMDAEVRAVGLEIAGSPSANKVGAVEACRSIVVKDKSGTGLLTDSLMVSESAWGRTPESWDNMVIRALGTVIHKNRSNIDLKRLASVLRKKPVGMWKASAIATAVGGGGSQTRSNRLIEVIVVNYNHGLRTASKNITK